MSDVATRPQAAPVEKQYPVCIMDAAIKQLATELLDAAGVTKEDKEKYDAEHQKYMDLLEHYYVTEFGAYGAGYENPFLAFAEAVSQKIIKMRG